MSIPGSGSPLLLATTAAAAAAEYVISKSLRFNSGDSAYLNKTFAYAGNRKTWSWSAWVKRSALGTNQKLFSAGTSSNYFALAFNTSDQIQVDSYGGGANAFYMHTGDMVFRDASAWYHLVAVLDTTESTGSDRFKLYINGSQVTLTVGTNVPPSNADQLVNSTIEHKIGNISFGGTSQHLNGYLADVQFVDGQALAPTDFGETRSSDGVWVPKEYSPATSPNDGTTWSNSCSGTIYSSSLGYANAFDGSLSTASHAANGNTITFTPSSAIPVSSSVRIFCSLGSITGSSGTADVTINGTSYVATANTNRSDGYFTVTGITSITSITWERAADNDLVAVSAIEVDGEILLDGFNNSSGYGRNGFHLNFSDSSTNEALGFDSAPTIPALDPKKGMDVLTWTGNGSTQNIGGLNFEPGLIWIKERGGTKDHNLYDSIRGATKELFPNGTGAENTLTNGLTSFNPDGFTLGSADRANGNTQTYVAWTWRAGGAAVANSDGAVTSQVSANTDYGFSIVTVTPTATGQTVGHGLNTTPSWIIYKNRDTAGNWRVHHTTLGTSKTLFLNTNASQSTSSDRVTAVTSSTFTLGDIVANDDHVAYCWSEVAGFSKFGSYAGSGASGKQVTGLGFKPRYLIVKAYDASASWVIVDSERGGDKLLFAEASNGDSSGDTILFLDDGFQIQGGGGDQNYSGRNYIYAAFADRPGNNWDVNNIVTNEGLTTSKTQFDVVTYSGTGSQQSISSLAFQPDLVWTKRRDGSSSHGWFDSVRGATKWLGSNSTNSEQTYSDSLTSFNSNGFTLGADTAWNGINQSSQTYVAWCWKAGGTAVSNTDGSITSSVSANPQHGFSIVSWDYDGTTGQYTVGHGLNTAPSMIIVRPREITSNWGVYHSALGNTAGINLNQTNGSSTSTGWWNNTSPTNSVFTLSTFFDDNSEYIAYCFADVPGYQRFGSYTGNGSSTGPVIVTGFKPRFLLAKKTSASGRQWLMLDSQRNPRNPLGNRLYAENIAGDDSADIVNFVSNGFEIISATSDLNDSGATYIYWAIGDDEIGSEEDCLVDVPNAVTADADATDTTGGYQRGNYCTWNPLDSVANHSLSNGNLDLGGYASAARTNGTISVSTGKWYFEVTNTDGWDYVMVGVGPAGTTNSYPGSDSTSWSFLADGNKYHNGTGTSVSPAANSAGDVIGVGLNLDDGEIYFYSNGVQVGSGAAYTNVSGTLTPAIRIWNSGNTNKNIGANFGQMRFKYPMPSGYAALNTTALPAATIPDGSAHFDTVTYTSDGQASKKLTFGFSPDFFWSKVRNFTEHHVLHDSVRGPSKVLKSSSTAAESTESSGRGVLSFDSDGVTIGIGSPYNSSGNNSVVWAWDAGSSTVSNTDGSITTSVRANQTAGFSIVTGTGSSSAAKTCGHGLNAEPHFIAVKLRVTAGNGYDQDWQVYHKDLGNTKGLKLNTTAATETSSSIWNNTSPTNSVFSIGASSRYDGNFVAYCFTPVAGYSAVGKYSGNGSSSGPFVHTGFRVAFILIKRTNSGSAWVIVDNKRDGYNETYKWLEPNTNNGEQSVTPVANVDFLSNGFKLRGNGATTNASGGIYVWLAFAENPFQANGGLAR